MIKVDYLYIYMYLASSRVCRTKYYYIGTKYYYIGEKSMYILFEVLLVPKTTQLNKLLILLLIRYNT